MRASYNAAATTNIRKPRRRRANQLEDEDGQSSADFGDEEDQDDFSSLGSLPGGVASSVAPNQSGHDPQIEEVQRLRLAMATKHGIEVLTLLAADEDGDGKIEKNEIVDLMEHAGQTNVAEVKKEFCAADTNSDGALSTSDKDNEKLAKFSELATRKMLRLPLRNAPFVPQRPDVQLACKVLNLDEIDCVGQSYFASIELWVAWEDATFDPTRPFGECWIPSVYFYNSKKHTLVTRGARTVGDHEFCGRTIRKGEAPHQWYYHIEVSAWYSEIFELADFPFDWQELHISIRMNDVHCRLAPLPWGDEGESIVFEAGMSVPEWTICTPRVEVCYQPIFRFGRAVNTYDPCINFVLVVRRTWRFYVTNLGPFIALIPCLAASPAFFDVVDGMEIRVGIDFTLVLTCVALKFLLHGNLPNVPYLTLLDRYVLCSFLLIAVMTIENGFISWYAKTRSPEEAESMDYKLWIAIGALWLVFQVCYAAYTWRLVRQRDKNVRALDYLDHTDIDKGKRTGMKYFEDAIGLRRRKST